MLILAAVVTALAIGFVFGRVWEIRQTLRQPKSVQHSAVRTNRLATPRNMLASHSKSPMGF